jgi:hypothetical protein
MESKVDASIIESLVTEYRQSKEFSDKVAARTDELKKELVRMVKAHGVPDDKGHLWLAAGDSQVKHERRVSRNLDRISAEEWARENGLWDSVKETIEVLSEDLLLKHFWENPDKEEELAKLYSNRETWAFKLVEKKSYDDDDE